MARLPIYSVFAALLLFLSAAGCKPRKPNTSGGKDIQTVNNAGLNQAGGQMWTITCKPGWVHVINGKETDIVTINDEDFAAGNLKTRYCATKKVTEVPLPPEGGGGNPGGGNPGGGNPGGTTTGLASIQKGYYTKTGGNIPCKVLSWVPVFQLGVLKRVQITCASSSANGVYQCDDALGCKKQNGSDQIEFWDDHFSVTSGEVTGDFSLSLTVLPTYTLTGYKEDGGCTSPELFRVSFTGKSLESYSTAGVSQFCAQMTAPTCTITSGTPLWGFRAVNECKDIINDKACDASAIKGLCTDELAPRVAQVFNAWANSP